MEPTIPNRIEATLLALLAVTLFILSGELAGAREIRELRFDGVNTEQQAITYWAIDLFAEAGLDRPSIDLVDPPDPADCGTKAGYAQYLSGVGVVHICINTSDPTIETRFLPGEPIILTEDYRPMIQWAMDLYDRANLELGGISIGIYDDPAACGDRRGFYLDGVATICAVHDNPTVQDAWRRHALLHELAHAWADSHLTDQQRTAFVDERNAATWHNHDQAWEDRATEHAAEIITWAIADYPVYPHIRLTDRTCDSFTAGYQTLTGTQPPNGYTDYCN